MSVITKFYDIKAWQKAHILTLEIYKTTKNYFPKEEIYALTSQIQRASMSITANIVEGFYRKSKKEQLRFYEISMSSLEEVKYHIILAKDLEYISIDQARKLYNQCNTTGKTLRGWMNN